MSIRYKFKNTTQYDTIIFDGNSISLGDFKREVIKQKHLTTDDDLKVVVAETKHEYSKLDDQIPKNASVIVSRVPRTPKTKKSSNTKRVLTPKTNCMNVEKTKTNDGLTKTILDLSKLNISEEKKIEVMMKQSTSVYSPSKYTKAPAKVLPAYYRCNKCHLAGHWIQDCPVLAPKITKITKGKAGIPRSFLNAESQNKENTFPQRQEVDRKLPGAPTELQCSICEDLLVDAVMVSCCGRTFCDSCIRCKLLETRNNECPECGEVDIDLDSLIPNRYMRKAVDTFKRERKQTETSSKIKT